MPRPGRYTPGKDTVPIMKETGWAPGPVWMGAENLAPTRIRSLDCPAEVQSLYQLHYPSPLDSCVAYNYHEVKVSRNRPGQAHGVPGRLRPQIFLMFSTMRVVGRQPYAPATFTPGEIPDIHF